MFQIVHEIKGGLGRAGVIHTPHGNILTPAFLTVGTHGAVRFVSMPDLRQIGAPAILSNGYHLRKTAPKIAAQGGLAAWSGWRGPTFTDSGGFQAMSLGSGIGKIVSIKRQDLLKTPRHAAHQKRLANITEQGIKFTDPISGQPDFIGPKESMCLQCQIGADIHMAFDELTSLADDYNYNKQALARTERWARISLAEHLAQRDILGYRQSLYGVLQGGRWKTLRRHTAKTLSKMQIDGIGFDGFGLGGAFLKEDLGQILDWCNKELPPEKPRHLLGLSHPDDLFIGVEHGADTFDCVAPTREARHGRIYTRRGNINLRKFADSTLPLDENCDCPTCRAGYSRGALRALFKSGDIAQKQQFYRLASLHNLRFTIRLLEQIRQSIIDDSFFEFRDQFLTEFSN